MKDYYKILDIDKNSSENDILKAYIFKISRYNHLPFLTDKMKIDVKNYKIAYYILLNSERKQKYDNIINNNINSSNTKINERLFSLKKY